MRYVAVAVTTMAAVATHNLSAQEVPMTSAATGPETNASGTQWTVGLGAGLLGGVFGVGGGLIIVPGLIVLFGAWKARRAAA